MSSFKTPHFIFLFSMKNGKLKVGYGTDADEAYSNLGRRLTKEELDQVIPDDPKKVTQREFRKYIEELG